MPGTVSGTSDEIKPTLSSGVPPDGVATEETTETPGCQVLNTTQHRVFSARVQWTGETVPQGETNLN